MKLHKWEDLKKEVLTDPEIEQIRQEAIQELVEEDLKAIRKIKEMTQVELATILGVTQGELSRLENRGDHRLSTLRRYVEALGGQLEVVARFDDCTVRLRSV